MQSEQFQLHSEIEMKHWWFQARRFIIRELIHNIIPPDKDELILDIGCGTGGNSAYLADEYSVIGIDVSLDAVRFAQKHWPSITFLHVDSINTNNKMLKNQIKKAKLILLMDVLEHINDDVDMLSTLVSNLTKGAYILITVPADMKLWSKHDISFGHCRRYEVSSFKKIFNNQPIQQLLISYFNSRLYLVIRIIRYMNQKTDSGGGLYGTDLKIYNQIINHFLNKIFSGESQTLLKLLTGEKRIGYSKGASLMAILQRI